MTPEQLAQGASVLAPASVEAGGLSSLTRLLMVVSVVVYVIVIVLLIMAVVRNRPATSPVPADLSRRSTRLVVIGGAILPGLILVGLFLTALSEMGGYPKSRDDGVSFQIIGHQWWWEIRAPEAGGFVTANELHVPVGIPVRLSLTTADVIHSFWVPELQGKMDLIPGQTDSLRFLATHPGVYRGYCAEFCGDQHANMKLIVVAEPAEQFEQWRAEQLLPSLAPADSELAEGARLVTTGPCAACHAIRGTMAAGRVGPDLTHVGSRLDLAGGAIPNTLGTMTAWITAAQSLKPGVAMPSFREFAGSQAHAMAAYLLSLK